MIAQLNKEYIRKRPSKVISRLISYLFFEGRPLTTKGQWINPFLFFGFRMICLLPQVRKVKSPIFIVGTGRSGSTLLGMLLSMHRQVGFLNEPKALWHFAFGNEDLIGTYSNGTAHYKMSEKHFDTGGAKRINKIFGFYLDTIFSSRVVDKYPELVFRMDFIKKIFPDAKILFLVRNGFQTSASTVQWIKEKTINKSNETHDWWGRNSRKWKLLLEQVIPESGLLSGHMEEIKIITDQTERAAVEWIVTMEEGITGLKKHPSMVLPVKYEDLVQNPGLELTKIFSFCNLQPDSKCLEYAKHITRSNLKNSIPPDLPAYLQESIRALMIQLGY